MTFEKSARGLLLAIFTVLCSMLPQAAVYAQSAQGRVEWASKVLGFSSEQSPILFGSKQALGRPNVLPNAWETPCGWQPSLTSHPKDGLEWIKVGFATPMKIRQIAIAESGNPGHVERILLYDTHKGEHEVYSGNAEPLAQRNRMMHIGIQLTEYDVVAVKIELNTAVGNVLPQIDAIGISESETPIEAEINLAKDVKVGPKQNLGPGVNSIYDEIYPVISPDGKTLYFDRKLHPGNIGPSDNIWYSQLQPDNTWGTAINIGRPLNWGASSYVCTVSPDGNTLLVGGIFPVAGQSTPESEVSLTHRIGKPSDAIIWSNPEALRIKNGYNRASTEELCLSTDGKLLLLSLERDDTYGQKDIYFSKQNPDGTWSEPKNLGPEVNSAGKEGTPFLAADGKTLYYSSNGFAGYGDVDVYMSRRLDDSWQHWSTPENLGPGINTAGWEAYYTVQASGEYAYFVSTSGAYGALGWNDIFRAKLPEALRPSAVVLVSGRVLDAKTKKPIECVIKYESLTTKQEVGTAHSTPSTGAYTISLPAGDQYGYRAELAGYISVNENLDLRNVAKYREMNRDLMLVPVEVGETVRVNNIFFETGRAELQPGSFTELDRLLDFLKSHPKMEIAIEGHTDNVGSAASNDDLSRRRALAVATYLADHGIPRKRTAVKGLGQAKPIATNETEEGRAQNRRVQFTIVKQ